MYKTCIAQNLLFEFSVFVLLWVVLFFVPFYVAESNVFVIFTLVVDDFVDDFVEI